MRKVRFLAAGEACTAMFWPTPGLTEGTLETAEFSAEGTLISVSAVPHPGKPTLEEAKGKYETESTGKAEIRKAEFLAVIEAYKAIIWPTQGLSDRISEIPSRGDLNFSVRGISSRVKTNKQTNNNKFSTFEERWSYVLQLRAQHPRSEVSLQSILHRTVISWLVGWLVFFEPIVP